MDRKGSKRRIIKYIGGVRKREKGRWFNGKIKCLKKKETVNGKKDRKKLRKKERKKRHRK